VKVLDAVADSIVASTLMVTLIGDENYDADE
jgi:hypothetical protein